MDFLTMVQKAIQWSGARSTLPTTLTGATGLVATMKDSVSLAWEHLQLERQDWRFNISQDATGILESGSPRFFLRGEGAGPKNIIQGEITYGDDGSASLDTSAPETIQYNIAKCTVLISDQTAATAVRPTNSLTFIPWDHWPYHNLEADDEEAMPRFYTLSPNGQMVLHPIADQDYRLFFRAPKSPQILENDADEITSLPEYLHKGVIWKGILYYGRYIKDAGIADNATRHYLPYKKWLERSEMTDVTVKKGILY